ncbi:MAG: hypothetical protein HFG77_07560 [Hungatella sp.]|nr:hypothetical protein [Dorea sp.]MCI9636238.1 hypothetical protein [Hungatella sp.]
MMKWYLNFFFGDGEIGKLNKLCINIEERIRVLESSDEEDDIKEMDELLSIEMILDRIFFVWLNQMMIKSESLRE